LLTTLGRGRTWVSTVSDTGLSGSVAIITGAASGLGLATARLLSADGARLVLVDWDAAQLEAASGFTGAVAKVQGDVSLPTTAVEVMTTAKERFGQVDILFNNAGIDPLEARSVTGTVLKDWDRIMEINLRSVFLMTRAVLPLMIEGGGGAIVSTASVAGLISPNNEAAYAVSKSAVIALTRSIACDYASSGIRANCLCPGMMEKVMVDRRETMSADMLAERSRAASAAVPLGREGTYEEIARTVRFLVSSDSSYVTGATLVVDGGLSCCVSRPPEDDAAARSAYSEETRV
jgi:NAD(P)-dependent dehydrogenase (short-subunit alcohol dehydrogenase family)